MSYLYVYNNNHELFASTVYNNQSINTGYYDSQNIINIAYSFFVKIL